MIEKALKDILKEQVSGLIWSANYKTLNDNYGVVYYEGGDPLNNSSDIQEEHLTYQVEVASSDFDKSKFKAQQVYELLNRMSNKTMSFIHDDDIDKIEVHHYLHFLRAETPPLRVGVIDDKMIYTINFVALVTPYCENIGGK